MQWDYGDGPFIEGHRTVLFCAWLAWSRFRVVLPLWDRAMASVVMALDRTLRRFGGAPTYALTDNERTVSIDQACPIAVRNPQIVSVGRHYCRRRLNTPHPWPVEKGTPCGDDSLTRLAMPRPGGGVDRCGAVGGDPPHALRGAPLDQEDRAAHWPRSKDDPTGDQEP